MKDRGLKNWRVTGGEVGACRGGAGRVWTPGGLQLTQSGAITWTG